jgi:hypothetical protein
VGGLALRKFATGDVYAFYSEHVKQYGAVQIITVLPAEVYVVMLDYISETKLTEDQLQNIKPLKQDRWFYKGRIYYFAGKLPENYIYIGNTKPLFTEKTSYYGGSLPSDNIIEAEYYWRKAPEKTRAAIKKADPATEVIVGGVTCRETYTNAKAEILSGISDISELDALVALRSICAEKFHDDLIPYLETRCLINELSLKNHKQNLLDFRETSLTKIDLDATDLESLYLNEQVRELSLTGDISPKLRIYSTNYGANLFMRIKLNAEFLYDFLLKNIKKISIYNINRLDCSIITELYPELTNLTLCGIPGYLMNVDKLCVLKNLKVLYLIDVFGFTEQEFPSPHSLPNLEELWLDSISEQVGKYLKTLYKPVVKVLDVRKLRKPGWIIENINNPFRHWDGSDLVPKSKAKKASELYKLTRKSFFAEVSEIKQYPSNINSVQDKLINIAKNYCIAFNKLNCRNNFIETEEREDIFDAFEEIINDAIKEFSLTDVKIDTPALLNAIDENRDW